MAIRDTWQRASRRQRILAVLAALYLVYALLGYFLLSPLVRKEIVAQLSDLTGRDVVLERFTFNPVGLAVTAENFALRDPDGEDFVAFDEFYADFELSSLFRWSWHFDEVALVRPRIRVTQEQDMSLNFDDILAHIDAASAATEGEDANEQDQASGGIPAVSIGQFHLDIGNFVFRDEARAQPDEIAFNEVSFDVVDFATAGSDGDNNSYKFEVTGPDGGHFLWQGNLDFDPLVAEGQLALEGLKLAPLAEFAAERLNFSIPEGELDIQTHYRYEAADDLVLSLSNGQIRLRDLQLDDRRTNEQVLLLPELLLSGISLDSVTQAAHVGELALSQPSVQMRLTPEGLDLASLFVPVEPVTPTPAPGQDGTETADVMADDLAENGGEKPAAQPETDAQDAWQFVLDTLRVEALALRLRDDTLPEPADVSLAPVSLTARNLSPNAGHTFTFEGTARVAEQGELGFTGEGELMPLRVQTAATLATLPLAMIEPWLRQSLSVSLASGELASTLAIGVEQAEQDVAVTVAGSSAITGFAMRETDGAPIVAFAGLDVSGIDISTASQTARFGAIAFDQLAVNGVVDEQGRHTGDRILVPVAAAADDESSEAWRVLVDRLSFSNGTVETLNRALSPNFRFGIYQLNGAMTNLDSASKKPASLDLSAKVDKYAPFSVKGTLNPLAAKPQADLVVHLEGYEMTGLTPFTGEYLGYTVSSGQLAFDTEVLLDNTFLDCRNRIHAANFFLGDKVESEEALKVPIKLGLSVLRDRNGVIELPVDAKGDLSDPSVSARGIILKALGNVLVKAATSPFSMLGALAGGADLSAIPYPAGSDELDADGRDSLRKLVAVMDKRPSLRFSLAGSVVPADRVALAERAEGQLLEGNDWEAVEASVSDRGFRRRLLKRYQELTGQTLEQFPLVSADGMTDAQKAQAELNQALAVWAALIERQQAQVPADQLQALAAQRAQLAKTVLVEELGQDATRLFIANPVVEGDQASQGVVLGLAGN